MRARKRATLSITKQIILSRLAKGCLIALLLLITNTSQATNKKGYTGSETCLSCHEEEANAWRQSDHYHSMLPASEQSVLGNFNDVTFNTTNRTTRFFKEGESYFVETLNEQAEKQTYEVVYTFGYRPLQQYLLRTNGGRLQAFDVVWDSRSKSQGGQRWYQLQGDAVTDPEHPFFWTGYFQNWNSRCASCHSTNLRKHYNPDNNTFNTTYSDVNVGCESCHGPGSEHVKLAAEGKLTASKDHGLSSLGKAIAFHFQSGDAIARPVPSTDQKNELAINTCGGCHSRRVELGEPDLAQPYHQQFQLDPIASPLYFDDGQIRDEVFVLGSFLQSKMAEAGVTCLHCHDPHSGKTRLPGAQVCASCHRPDVFMSDSHTLGHKDANCLDCHMPARTYMGVDDRRDHKFHRPSAQSIDSVSPCATCHQAKSTAWLRDALRKWPTRSGAAPDTSGLWATLNAALSTWSPKAIVESTSLLTNPQIELPDLLTTALTQKVAAQAPQEAAELIKVQATSSSVILRRGAVQAISALPTQQQADILAPMINDPTLSVRSEVAAMLLSAPVNSILPEAQIQSLLTEYETTLQASRDHPGANSSLALLALRRGNIAHAQMYYKAALGIDPANLPALLNFADLLTNIGSDALAKKYLTKALAIAPDSGTVQFSYGLMLVREKRYNEANTHLEKATLAEDANPRFAFTYGVSLWQLKQFDKALAVLDEAATKWPSDYNLLVTLVKYAFMNKNMTVLKKAVTALGEAYPQDKVYLKLKPLVQH